ncbi:hypothetical protein [Anaerosalibacter massiliensis]|uniref:hypothetical protein n=1 Tax=Anaerosalibacter massiliensis TaxID=1347392 RepID=UPI00164D8D5A|nr:hypothetical protein [Anaerosalibacter massiliensis]
MTDIFLISTILNLITLPCRLNLFKFTSGEINDKCLEYEELVRLSICKQRAGINFRIMRKI